MSQIFLFIFLQSNVFGRQTSTGDDEALGGNVTNLIPLLLSRKGKGGEITVQHGLGE